MIETLHIFLVCYCLCSSISLHVELEECLAVLGKTHMTTCTSFSSKIVPGTAPFLIAGMQGKESFTPSTLSASADINLRSSAYLKTKFTCVVLSLQPRSFTLYVTRYITTVGRTRACILVQCRAVHNQITCILTTRSYVCEMQVVFRT